MFPQPFVHHMLRRAWGAACMMLRGRNCIPSTTKNSIFSHVVCTSALHDVSRIGTRAAAAAAAAAAGVNMLWL
jgi:hypothetical protein